MKNNILKTTGTILAIGVSALLLSGCATTSTPTTSSEPAITGTPAATVSSGTKESIEAAANAQAEAYITACFDGTMDGTARYDNGCPNVRVFITSVYPSTTIVKWSYTGSAPKFTATINNNSWVLNQVQGNDFQELWSIPNGEQAPKPLTPSFEATVDNTGSEPIVKFKAVKYENNASLAAGKEPKVDYNWF